MSASSTPAQVTPLTPEHGAPAPAPEPAPPSTSAVLQVLPVTGLGEVRAGDDLATLLAAALAPLSPREGDVLCVSTKIVSKALDLRVSPEERNAAIARAAVRTVARRRHTRVVTSVVQIPSGPVMAAAGVDSSNAPDGPLLLPEDPDACAAQLREGLAAALGIDLGVVLTDTSSRVWRVGVTDIALGASGVASLQDLRGGTDADGRTLHVTVRNLADELAAAADLVKGKASGVPAALVRGVPDARSPEVPARELSRTGGEDWFRRPSLESAWVALGLGPEQEPIARMSPEPDEERIARALAVAAIPRDGAAPLAARAHLSPVGPAGAPAQHAAPAADASPVPAGVPASTSAPGTIVVRPADGTAAALIDAATLAERVRTALGAETLAAPLPPLEVHLDTSQINTSQIDAAQNVSAQNVSAQTDASLSDTGQSTTESPEESV